MTTIVPYVKSKNKDYMIFHHISDYCIDLHQLFFALNKALEIKYCTENNDICMSTFKPVCVRKSVVHRDFPYTKFHFKKLKRRKTAVRVRTKENCVWFLLIFSPHSCTTDTLNKLEKQVRNGLNYYCPIHLFSPWHVISVT